MRRLRPEAVTEFPRHADRNAGSTAMRPALEPWRPTPAEAS